MKIFPAIDLRGGRVVRLIQGDYGRETVYADDPAAVAEGFLKSGAKYLHVVDLDGAREGAQANVCALRRLAEIKGLYTEVGGGIRDERAVERCLSLGVGRVILGTVAVTDYAFVKNMLARYGDRIAVGVDARAGYVAIDGWRTVTDVRALDLCEKLESDGLSAVIVTDIARDGELSGVNLSGYRRLCERLSMGVIASGGVSSAADIEALRDLGVDGAIIGKALYAGAMTLPDVLAAAGGSKPC